MRVGLAVTRSPMELHVLVAFREWSLFAKWTYCSSCEAWRYCGARRLRGRWLCVECFEFSPEGRRFMEERESR